MEEIGVIRKRLESMANPVEQPFPGLFVEIRELDRPRRASHFCELRLFLPERLLGRLALETMGFWNIRSFGFAGPHLAEEFIDRRQNGVRTRLPVGGLPSLRGTAPTGRRKLCGL
jgi:hypothetical protein